MSWVLVTLVEVKGSAPREVGASMAVSASTQEGTIGGGRLEHQAIKQAQSMLAENAVNGKIRTQLSRETLNTDFDQCCGGVVTLLFEQLGDRQYQARMETGTNAEESCIVRFAELDRLTDSPEFIVTRTRVTPGIEQAEASVGRIIEYAQQRLQSQRIDNACEIIRLNDTEPARSAILSFTKPCDFNITLFGAGHVGRALVDLLARQDCRVRWIDHRDTEFPTDLPKHIECIRNSSPAAEVADAPPNSYFLVMTPSHDLDFEICDHILVRDDVRFLGLIGSNSKAQHFRKQFAKRGLDASEIDRLTCPIGIDGIHSKQPAVIAVAVVAQLLTLQAQYQNQNTRMQAAPSITGLNSVSSTEFVETLAGIFEHSPWVAEAVAEQRPFADVDKLYASMVAAVQAAQPEQKLALLQAHPQLAGREAQRGELTESSTSEQASAQLNALSADEMSHMQQLNRDYLAKFGFPFIIAVRNHTKASIFSEFERRLQNNKATEQATALQQVAEIARIRLNSLFGDG